MPVLIEPHFLTEVKRPDHETGSRDSLLNGRHSAHLCNRGRDRRPTVDDSVLTEEDHLARGCADAKLHT